MSTAPLPMHDLEHVVQWLSTALGLIAEPPHSGTWRNLFYQRIDRHPATSTRVIKVLADAQGRADRLQLCATSDNNHSVLFGIPEDLRLLTPIIEREIDALRGKRVCQSGEPAPPRIRPAHAADARLIAELHAQSWRIAYRGILRDAYLQGDILADRQALWQQRLVAPADNQLVLVAHEGNELIGLACAFGGHDTIWGTLLENLHVAPAHKRRGIGRALVHRVHEWSAQRHPGSGLHLWVLAPNTPAQRFYQRLGASAVEASVWAAPDGSRVDQHRYAWP